MKKNISVILTSTILSSVFLLALSISKPSYALFGVGDIVFDPTIFGQSVITATEEVSQTLKQIEEYQTQLEQYENQLKNTLAPATYVWDKATGTISKMRGMVDTLNYYKNSMGNLDRYLMKYQDVNFYRNSSCYRATGCTQAEREELEANLRMVSEAQKRANDGLFKGINQQQDDIEADARQLEILQSDAQGAEGHLQAIQYANQLASAQANQILQMRTILLAQANAIATRNQALADKEAQEAAAGEQLRRSQYQPSPVVNWGPSANHP